MKRKGLYVLVGGIALLAILVGGVGVAYAQGWVPPIGEGRPFQGDSPDVEGDFPGFRGGPGGPGGRMGPGMQGHSLVDATAEATGLTTEEVITALQEGQTFAEIAEAEGIDPQDIVDVFVSYREEELAEAVAEGRLTQEQADGMLAEMAEHVAEHLDQPWNPRGGPGGPGGMGRGRPGCGGRRGGPGGGSRFGQDQ